MRIGRAVRRIVALALCVTIGSLALVAIGTVASRAGTASAQSAGPGLPGYWLVASDGGIYNLNTANFGSVRGIQLNQPVVGGTATPDGLGYWMVASDGGIFAFGDARFYGSTGSIRLNRPIVGMTADPKTGGYWMVASDGGVFAFNAPFLGSTGSIRLNKPIVGMAVTPDAGGYWLVASDGGVFAFGDARFYGSTGSIRLNQPIVGMASTSTGHGYWLAASDGGIFAFGDAGFFGSTGGIRLVAPVKSIQATSDGQGYWMSAYDGGVFTFGDAPFLGSAATAHSPAPIVAMMATSVGYPLPPGSTGYDVSYWNWGKLPSSPGSFAVVEIAGAIDGAQNPYYQQEIAWAGANASSYIFMDQLPSPAPPEAMSGPAGNCGGSKTCQGYNFGWYWARNWVSVSQSLGVNTPLWWLDVEVGPWATDPTSQTTNSSVISGAVAGLRSMGVLAGIYSTAYQWGLITGNQLTFPDIALWMAGAGPVSGGSNSAQSFCAGGGGSYYAPFAGGTIVLVQYGWTAQGQQYPVDPDYACPA
jgi:hypothetical protein